MASLASSAVRTTSRLGSKSNVAAATLCRLPRGVAVAAKKIAGRRTYVTESKPDNARVETAIKLDKKDFTDIPPPSMGTPANAKVSPMAGT